MRSLLRAEFAKLVYRRLTWGLVAGAFGMSALAFILIPVAGSLLSATGAPNPLAPVLVALKGPAGFVYAGTQVGAQFALFAVILGGIVTGAEFSAHTMTLTLAREPRRPRVLVAKVLALTVFSLLACVGLWLFGLVMVLAVQPLLGPDVPTATAPSVPLVRSAAAVLLGIPGLAMWSALSVSLGLSTRNAGAAAGLGVSAWTLPTLLTAVPGVAYVLPTNNVAAVTAAAGLPPEIAQFGVPGGLAIGPWQGLVVVAVYTAAALGLGVWALRRDVTDA